MQSNIICYVLDSQNLATGSYLHTAAGLTQITSFSAIFVWHLYASADLLFIFSQL